MVGILLFILFKIIFANIFVKHINCQSCIKLTKVRIMMMFLFINHAMIYKTVIPIFLLTIIIKVILYLAVQNYFPDILLGYYKD